MVEKERCKKCKTCIQQIHYHTRRSSQDNSVKSYQVGYICLECGSILLIGKHNKLEIEKQIWIEK